MGDRALTTLIDERGEKVATLYSHWGGSGCWMLPKIARWVRDDDYSADLSKLAVRLLTEGAGMELMPHGVDAGEEHRWSVRIERSDATGWRNVPTVTRIEPRGGWTTDYWRTATTTTYEGPVAIVQAAADELRATARRMEQIIEENHWSPEVAARVVGDPAEVYAEADLFAPQAVQS